MSKVIIKTNKKVFYKLFYLYYLKDKVLKFVLKIKMIIKIFNSKMI